jgi:hypothetical protein
MTSRHEIEKLDREWREGKERHGSVPRPHRLLFVGQISMVVGFALAAFGVWLDERLFPGPATWPAFCMILGTCLVLGSIVFIIRNGWRLRAYHMAKRSYDCRREKLLEDLYASGQRATAGKENNHAAD